MNTLRLFATTALCAAASGCFTPNTVATRRFILTPVPATAVASTGLRLGVGDVQLPGYLLSSSLAVRGSGGEIVYRETSVWAERLDHGFTRVLTANLGALLPTDQVRLSAWRATDVAVEVHITVDRFDVDQAGTGTLVAWWRITAPGGARILQSGETRLTQAGPAPANDAGAIANTLSELVAGLSRALVPAIRAAVPLTN